MPTVNKQITDIIIANNGYYPVGEDDGCPDPQVVAVIRYENDFDGNYSYGICYNTNQILGYLGSPHCFDPTVLAATQEALDYVRSIANSESDQDIANVVYSHWVSATVVLFTE